MTDKPRRRDQRANPNIYPNNLHEARRVGWDRLEEYCIGDRDSPYVFHDHKKGYFHYIDEDEKKILEQMENPTFHRCGDVR